MPTLKRTLHKAKMNKDVDERLLPAGEYEHIENLRPARNIIGDKGAGNSVKGTVKLTNYNIPNARCIGEFKDASSGLIYGFITSPTKDMIYEYDVAQQSSTIVLESTKPDGVLNFNEHYLITGINKFINSDAKKNLLAWTDDYNPPRIINIARAKTYGLDGFEEADISVIKRPPIYAPTFDLTYTASTLENNLEDKCLQFAYRYIYLDGEASALSQFSNPAFSPSPFDLDYQTMENNGMVNAFNAVRVYFNTGSHRVKEIQLVFKSSIDDTINVIDTFDKEELGWSDDVTEDYLFSNDKIYGVLPTKELYRAFDNVPLLAKAQEVIGNRLVYSNYLYGYDMIDLYGDAVALDYDISLINDDISGESIPITVITLDTTDDGITLNLSGFDLSEGTSLVFNIGITETYYGVDGSYEGNNSFILNEDFNDATELAASEAFILFLETILTNSFLANYTFTEPDNSERIAETGFEIESSTATSITIKAPTLTYRIDNTPLDTEDDDFTDEVSTWAFDNSATSAFYSANAINSSLKTNRSYELGLIYKDENLRGSTVQTEINNTLYIPQEYSTYRNRLRVNINHKPPAWAKYYSFAIKQNRGNYETIYVNLFYKDGLFRWVKLEGANRDKVKEGDTLIVKSDLNGARYDIIKVRVLEIVTKDKDFIEGNENVDGDEIIEEAGVYMKIKPEGFDMNIDDATSRTYYGSQHLRYPVRCYTSPLFGEVDEADLFTPYALGAGSTVRIYINFKARGSISYEATYDKTFRVGGDFDSIEEWFNAEVVDLGTFGDDYTREWGFTDDGSQFFVFAHRDGTASRKITTTLKFEVLSTEGTVIFETEPTEFDDHIFYETSQTFAIENGNHLGNVQDQDVDLVDPAIVELDAFNCYVQGNGAESFKIKDVINKDYVSFNLRPSTVSVDGYRAIRYYADFTYGQPYVESSNFNGLNEFNAYTANFKDDLDRSFGAVQKLFTRDTDLLVFQEDKVHKILFGKDLLYNADGTGNLSAVEDVLNTHVAYAGEYGISKNPESFDYNGNSIYFTDAKRGYVLRLNYDGITEISAYGMRSYFKQYFDEAIYLKQAGAFNPFNDTYVLGGESHKISKVKPTVSDGIGLILRSIDEVETAFIEFGNVVGTDAGVDFDVTEGEATIDIEWNGTTVSSGAVSGTGTLRFDKTFSFPKTANLTVTPNGEATVNIAITKPTVNTYTVIPLVVNDADDAGKTNTNRFKWKDNNSITGWKTYDSVMSADNVAEYELLTGNEGTGVIAPTGSTVYVSSVTDRDDTKPFEVNNRLGYYVSNTLIASGDYQTVIDNATWLTETETKLEDLGTLNEANFTLARPSGEQYLYLVWDYTDKP